MELQLKLEWEQCAGYVSIRLFAWLVSVQQQLCCGLMHAQRVEVLSTRAAVSKTRCAGGVYLIVNGIPCLTTAATCAPLHCNMSEPCAAPLQDVVAVASNLKSSHLPPPCCGICLPWQGDYCCRLFR